ncbi:MAG: ssDNA-binding domain-containing protein [Eubacterium sp.]|nr:ssDNA-binding domain-containing protein [Eubacterium sp.]
MELNKMRKELADAFIASLNEKELPWTKGWSVVRNQNAINGHEYRGVNAFWLAYISQIKGYKDPRWCTYKQAAAKGWQVKRGEKGTHIEFWSMYDKETKRKLTTREVSELREQISDEEFSERIKPISNVYSVFNAEQIEGIPELQIATQEYDKDICIEIRDDVIKGLEVGFIESGDQAFYSPREDSITMPPMDAFWDEYSYLATFLHEAGHSTGSKSRMNRDLSGSFGTESYAKEELRAEIASAFTTQAIGLDGTMSKEHIDNHKAYIQNWVQILKDDPNELFRAINEAAKISDFVIEKGNLQRFIREFKPVMTEQEDKSMEEAKILLQNFCQSEYGNNCDFKDLSNVEIAYSTWTNDDTNKEYEIQAAFDLEEHMLIKYVDGDGYYEKKYDSLEDMIETELKYLDFADLVTPDDSTIEKIKEKEINDIAMADIDRHEAEIFNMIYPGEYEDDVEYIAKFKAKTKEYFQGIEGMSLEEVEGTLKEYVAAVIMDSEISVDIEDVLITGSRSRGYNFSTSDLDVVVAYNGTLPEDALFNLLNDKGEKLGKVKIDFNPISLYKRRSLADTLKNQEEYMKEKIEKLPYIPQKVENEVVEKRRTCYGR